VLGRLLARWKDRREAVTAVRAAARPDAPLVLTGMGASFAAVSIAEPVWAAGQWGSWMPASSGWRRGTRHRHHIV
jgi:hypothetical protein